MKRHWLMVFLVPSLVGAAASGCQQSQPKPEMPPPEVRYELPITGPVKDYEDLPGRTDAIVKVQVRSRVSGYMNGSYFKDGTYVEKDAKLFEIDTRPFMADRDRAKGTVDQLDAHLHRLERSYNRAKNLLSRGSVSPEEFDQYEADYKETAAQLEVAKANLHLAELNLEWTDVRAPSAGLLSRRLVDPGNLVRADDTILTSIVSLDPLYVYFDPADSTMLKLRRLIQQRKAKHESEHDVPVRIFLPDEDEKSDSPHEGTIDFTDNQVDANTGTMTFRAKLRNVDHFIAPGLFVRVRLPIGDEHPAVMIREQAMERDQDKKRVWLLADDLVVSSASNAVGITAKGKNLVVVAAVKDVLHFRFFDGQGRMVVDTNEARLAQRADKIKSLRKDLDEKKLWPPHELTGSEKGEVVSAVASIVGHSALLTRSDIAADADPNERITCIAVPRYVTPGVARDGSLEIKEGVNSDDLVIVEGMQKLRPGIVVSFKRAKPAGAAAAFENTAPPRTTRPVDAARGPLANPSGPPVKASTPPLSAAISEPANRLGQVRRRDEAARSLPGPAFSSPRQPQRHAPGPRASR